MRSCCCWTWSPESAMRKWKRKVTACRCRPRPRSPARQGTGRAGNIRDGRNCRPVCRGWKNSLHARRNKCVCKACGKDTVVIGYERSERLDVEPARYLVVVTKREKRACKGCADGVSAAPLPERIIEKGLVSDRVVIDTLVSKYSDHCVPRTYLQQWRYGTV